MSQAAGTCLSPVHPPGAPPTGSLPVRATNQDLRCYEFPARLIDLESRQEWNRLMEHALRYLPPVIRVLTCSSLNSRSGWITYT